MNSSVTERQFRGMPVAYGRTSRDPSGARPSTARPRSGRTAPAAGPARRAARRAGTHCRVACRPRRSASVHGGRGCVARSAMDSSPSSPGRLAGQRCRSSSRLSMIDSLDCSRSARICSRARGRAGRLDDVVSQERPRAGRGCPVAAPPQGTPARCREAPGRRSAVPRYAICSGTVGQHQRQQREDVGQALPGPRFTNPSTKRLSSTSSSSRWLSQTGRPTASSRRTRSNTRSTSTRTKALRSTMAASDRPQWNRTSNRRSSRPSSTPSGRALRDADRKHARQPAAHGERLVRVEQRVDRARPRAPRPRPSARGSRRRPPDPRPAAG